MSSPVHNASYDEAENDLSASASHQASLLEDRDEDFDEEDETQEQEEEEENNAEKIKGPKKPNKKELKKLERLARKEEKKKQKLAESSESKEDNADEAAFSEPCTHCGTHSSSHTDSSQTNNNSNTGKVKPGSKAAQVLQSQAKASEAAVRQEMKESKEADTLSFLKKNYPTVQKKANTVMIDIQVGTVPNMRTNGIVFANDALAEILYTELQEAKTSFNRGGFIPAIVQLANACSLPGIVGPAVAMADIHSGYGLPIGGVIAVDMENPESVVSPGAIGYDVNCGVRLLATNLTVEDLTEKKLKQLADSLFSTVPVGVGTHSAFKLNSSSLERILNEGVEYLVEQKLAWPEDIDFIEERGRMPDADASCVSDRAKKRGMPQVGSLGSGNHYIEVQRVEEIFAGEEKTAETFGLKKGQIVIMIHSGSRGLGHQVCTDYVNDISRDQKNMLHKLNDKQLAPIPIQSKIGQKYLKAMAAAANYAFCNRALLTHDVRSCFAKVFGKSAEELGMRLVYDVSHNIAKQERHLVDGKIKKVLVSRKGSTRCFPAGHPDIPKAYQQQGQPVVIGGSMGTESYCLVGTIGAMQLSFGSTCHGAGRALSRSGATRSLSSEDVIANLKQQGIELRCAQMSAITEEAPEAYKDVTSVVDTCQDAGITRKVAKLKPMAVIKG